MLHIREYYSRVLVSSFFAISEVHLGTKAIAVPDLLLAMER